MTPVSNFFAISCAILALSVVNLSIGPIVNKKVGTSWDQGRCEYYSDLYANAKKSNPNMDEETKKNYEYTISDCSNKKAMYNMEYTSFVFNMAIGFICVLLGLYGFQKEVLPKTGIIGMALGALGFILTLVYVIYNGVVYTNYYTSEIYKRDGDGAYAEFNEEVQQYECYYFSDYGDTRALYAKYSDLIKSQYNYNYDLDNSFNEDYEKGNCTLNSYISSCTSEYIQNIPNPIEYYDYYGSKHTCSKLYYHRSSEFTTYSNYDISARFLTVLLLSIVILLCYCGLIFFGFNLSKPPS